MTDDSLGWDNGRPFSTKDRDNDEWPGGNCAVERHGAWWYGGCFQSNLNGKYRNVGRGDGTGLYWWHWKRSYIYSMKRVSMKIRPN